ncbi:Helix-turn-helix domain protein (modular protein) [Flavobacterium psychrophilum]|uniref:helix-turn-helix transcriptional regulator n=1 Tax=Flavobacterium psychrophilum TaxID=96345 RepID=UPI000B7C096B|nr:helix-turn-helix transcriptional regulator [Flavobacterium psychrophilum]SNB23841.1 Helix-turn-helix domain protein (modular protein) [Flavobacterium psychrophilum]
MYANYIIIITFDANQYKIINQKLINRRTERNLSQDEFADLLGITQSQYSRRENGVTKISKKEWDKMAKVLNTTLDDIYDPEDGIYIINNENASGNYSGSQNHFHQIPDHVLETMRKYIEKLEEDNLFQKKEISRLNQEINLHKEKLNNKL